MAVSLPALAPAMLLAALVLGNRLGVSSGTAPTADLPVLPLGAAANFSLASWTSTRTVQQRSATVEWALPSFTKSAELHVLPSLLSPELTQAIIKQLPQQVNTDPDSVDSLPTFEFPIESFQLPSLLDTDGEAGQARAALREVTASPIADVILPYVRAKYNCPRCKVCTSMLRRYLPGERRRHPAHFDTQAYVTVVVSLSAFGEDFTGGLYVRRGGSGPGGVGEGDAYLPLDQGDAVAHQFDVEHGVEVVGGGERYSWILWMQDEDVCAAGGKASWHEQAASAGDPVAMYNLGNTMTSDPMDGEAVARAHSWFVRAAEGGYAAAMYSAGVMHVQGPPTVEQNPSKGLVWLEKAAALGDLHAKYNTGFMLTQGVGGEGRMEEGLAWFEEAATDGDAKSAFALAAMYLGQGEAFGVAKDEAKAHEWMSRASELGHTEATYKLGRELLMQASVDAPAPPKGRKGRRKKQRQNAGSEAAGGVSFRTSDLSFVEGHALLKKAAAYGHEGAASIALQLDMLVRSSGADSPHDADGSGSGEGVGKHEL